MNKQNCRSHPFRTFENRMVTLADLYSAIEDGSAPGWTVVSVADRRELLITIRRIAEMNDYPMDLIDIDEIVGSSFANELFDYVLARGILRQCAVRYQCMVDRLLLFANSCGWEGNSEYALHRSWDQVRAALKGGHGGCSGIVDFAIKLGKSPDKLTHGDVEIWMNDMLDRKRSLGTVIITERCFRLQLKRSNLQKLFLQFNLESRNPTEYRLPLEQMCEALRKEILTIIHWKTSSQRVKGRASKFKIRQTTAKRLLEVLTQVCGYAIHIWRIKNLRTLRQVLKKDIICGFADWLLKERKCTPGSVRTVLRALHALTWQYPLFKGPDYSWFTRKIRQLPHEPKAARRQRQIDKMVPYELLAQVPAMIREERIRSTDLSPVKLSQMVRDEVFMAWPFPWRQINFRNFNLLENLKTKPLSRDIKRKMLMPKSMEAELKRNPYQAVVYSHHKEDSTKTKKEIFEAIPLETLPLLREYIAVHRPRLVGDKQHSFLFVNDAGMPMCKQDVIALVTRITMKYLRRRVLPHARRRIVATYALSSGETIEAVQKMMWQTDPATTWLYADAASSSSGAVALEDHYTSAGATL